VKALEWLAPFQYFTLIVRDTARSGNRAALPCPVRFDTPVVGPRAVHLDAPRRSSGSACVIQFSWCQVYLISDTCDWAAQ
jgi:hypothetical protein